MYYDIISWICYFFYYFICLYVFIINCKLWSILFFNEYILIRRYIYFKVIKLELFICQNIYTRDQQYCINNITNNPYLIKYIKNQTDEIVKLSLERSLYCSLLYVKNKTPEIINLSLYNNPYSIKLIEDKYKTYDICYKVIRNSNRYIDILKYIPNKFHTKELLELAVKNNPDALYYIENKTKELSLLSVFYDGVSIRYVPNQTKDLCKISIKTSLMSLQYIDKKLIDYDMCCLAIQRCIYSFEHIPKELIDYDLCCLAIKIDISAIKYIPKKFIDYDLCYLALTVKPVYEYDYSCSILKYIPIHIITYELCELAIKLWSYELKYVPKKLIDYDLCCLSVNTNKYKNFIFFKNQFTYIPKELIDYYLCRIAIENGLQVLKYVPKELIDYNLCCIAININGGELQFVPKKLIDYNLCLLAIDSDYTFSLNYVPKHLIDYNLCKKTIQKIDGQMRYIPKKLIDIELWKIIYSREPCTDDYLDEDKMTDELKIFIIKNKLSNGYTITIKYDKELLIKCFDNIINKNLDECPICDIKQKYYVSYNCHDAHIICIDCLILINKCYYNCDDGNINMNNIYINY